MVHELLRIAQRLDDGEPALDVVVQRKRTDLRAHLRGEAAQDETVQFVCGLRPGQPSAESVEARGGALPPFAVFAFSRVLQQRSYIGHELAHDGRTLPDVGSSWKQQHPGPRSSSSSSDGDPCPARGITVVFRRSARDARHRAGHGPDQGITPRGFAQRIGP
jgi:hypothetical protein